MDMHLPRLFVSHSTSLKAVTAINNIWSKISSNMHNKARIHLKTNKAHMFRHWEKGPVVFIWMLTKWEVIKLYLQHTPNNITGYMWLNVSWKIQKCTYTWFISAQATHCTPIKHSFFSFFPSHWQTHTQEPRLWVIFQSEWASSESPVRDWKNHIAEDRLNTRILTTLLHQHLVGMLEEDAMFAAMAEHSLNS